MDVASILNRLNKTDTLKCNAVFENRWRSNINQTELLYENNVFFFIVWVGDKLVPRTSGSRIEFTNEK